MLPFEFTVEGSPISHQSGNRAKLADWQKKVRAAATAQWPGGSPLTLALRIAVAYYHDRDTVALDNDNLLKPIQDALIGLVYSDDRLITDTVVRKTRINGAFRVRGASFILLQALSVGNEFLHIMIEAAPDHTILLS
jgi:hypothetical protein